jgi:hypothetical protein
MADRNRLSCVTGVLSAREAVLIGSCNLSLQARDQGKLGNEYVSIHAHVVMTRPQISEDDSSALMAAGYQFEVEGETPHG